LNDPTENSLQHNKRYAFFVGCTVAYKLPHIEAATRYVMDTLALDPVDLPFSCCPDPNAVHSYSAELWVTRAARNLALAEEQVLDYRYGVQRMLFDPQTLPGALKKRCRPTKESPSTA
jgi:hypothetical protein